MEQDVPYSDFDAVVNDEGQYSVWPTNKALPNGWRKTGTSGTKDACLEHIKSVWTDMRPASLRNAMEATSD